MANCLLAYPDLSLTATLSGGSWSTPLPLDNIKSSALHLVARSSNALASSTLIKADLGAIKAISVISIIRHNMTSSAQVRITGSNNSDYSSPIYSGSWSAVPTASPGYQPTYTVGLSASARYWQIEINDSTNGAGYVEMGRIFIGTGFRPTINMSYGCTLGLVSDTTAQRAMGGTDYWDTRPVRRTWRLIFEYQSETDGLSALDIQANLNTSGQLFFLHSSDDTPENMIRKSFLATVRQLTGLEFPYVNSHKIGFELLEVL